MTTDEFSELDDEAFVAKLDEGQDHKHALRDDSCASVNRAFSPEGYACTLKAEHVAEGTDHIACGYSDHKIAIWPVEKGNDQI